MYYYNVALLCHIKICLTLTPSFIGKKMYLCPFTMLASPAANTNANNVGFLPMTSAKGDRTIAPNPCPSMNMPRIRGTLELQSMKEQSKVDISDELTAQKGGRKESNLHSHSPFTCNT